MEAERIVVSTAGVRKETITLPEAYFAVTDLQPDENVLRDMLLAEHEMRLLLLENGF